MWHLLHVSTFLISTFFAPVQLDKYMNLRRIWECSLKGTLIFQVKSDQTDASDSNG